MLSVTVFIAGGLMRPADYGFQVLLFGFQSGAALATVVGVLIEVPVMLLVVRIVNHSRGWYDAGACRA